MERTDKCSLPQSTWGALPYVIFPLCLLPPFLSFPASSHWCACGPPSSSLNVPTRHLSPLLFPLLGVCFLPVARPFSPSPPPTSSVVLIRFRCYLIGNAVSDDSNTVPASLCLLNLLVSFFLWVINPWYVLIGLFIDWLTPQKATPLNRGLVILYAAIFLIPGTVLETQLALVSVCPMREWVSGWRIGTIAVVLENVEVL